MTSTGRNVGLLAACQALLFTNNSTLIAINGLAGLEISPYVGVPTPPVADLVFRCENRPTSGVSEGLPPAPYGESQER